MRISYHIVISLVVSVLIYGLLRSIAGALVCFVTGVFIDLDHFVDYLLNYGPHFRLRHFFRAFRYEVLENIFIFLHAWEWTLVMLVILWLVDWKPVAVGLFSGACIHLLLDDLFNTHSPLAYFLLYRLAHRFSARRFYGTREYQKRLKNAKEAA